jgi:hypothetical protein
MLQSASRRVLGDVDTPMGKQPLEPIDADVLRPELGDALSLAFDVAGLAEFRRIAVISGPELAIGIHLSHRVRPRRRNGFRSSRPGHRPIAMSACGQPANPRFR